MALLRLSGFRFLLAGFFFSAFAPWAQRIAVLIWTYSLTHSGAMVSVVGLMEALPFLVLAPFAGVFVDRWSRSRTMTAAVLFQAVALLPLLLVHDVSGLWIILLVTLLVNSASQFFMPSATASIPVVVGPDQVGAANGIIQTINSTVTIMSPALSSLLYAAVGPHALVLVLVLIYLAAAPLLAAVPSPRPSRSGLNATSVGTEMRAGLQYVLRSRMICSILVVGFVALLGAGALNVLDVVFVTRALHMHSDAVGILFTASGCGQLIGGLAMVTASRWAAPRFHLLLGYATVIVGLGVALYASAPNLAVAIVALLITGSLLTPLMVSFMSLIQLAAEDAYMGRVMSLVNSGMTVASVISLAGGGILADAFGVRQVMSVCGVLILFAGMLTFALVRSTPPPHGTPALPAVQDLSEAPVRRRVTGALIPQEAS